MKQYLITKKSGVPWAEIIPESWDVIRGKNILTLLSRPIKEDDEIITCFRDGQVTLRKNRREEGFTSLRVGRATERGIITSAYVTIRPMKGINSEYLYYALHAFDLKKGLYGMGSGVRQGLNYDGVKMVKIPFAPKKVQSQIVQYLNEKCEKIDAVMAEKQILIADLELYRRSLVYETVTGKRKVV